VRTNDYDMRVPCTLAPFIMGPGYSYVILRIAKGVTSRKLSVAKRVSKQADDIPC